MSVINLVSVVRPPLLEKYPVEASARFVNTSTSWRQILTRTYVSQTVADTMHLISVVDRVQDLT